MSWLFAPHLDTILEQQQSFKLGLWSLFAAQVPKNSQENWLNLSVWLYVLVYGLLISLGSLLRFAVTYT